MNRSYGAFLHEVSVLRRAGDERPAPPSLPVHHSDRLA